MFKRFFNWLIGKQEEQREIKDLNISVLSFGENQEDSERYVYYFPLDKTTHIFVSDNKCYSFDLYFTDDHESDLKHVKNIANWLLNDPERYERCRITYNINQAEYEMATMLTLSDIMCVRGKFSYTDGDIKILNLHRRIFNQHNQRFS